MEGCAIPSTCQINQMLMNRNSYNTAGFVYHILGAPRSRPCSKRDQTVLLCLIICISKSESIAL